MNMTAESQGVPASDRPIPVAGSLTIYTVEAHAMAWKAELARTGALNLDLSGVTDCDTLGIQLLCAVRGRAEPATGITLAHPSPAIWRAAAAVAAGELLSLQP